MAPPCRLDQVARVIGEDHCMAERVIAWVCESRGGLNKLDSTANSATHLGLFRAPNRPSWCHAFRFQKTE